MSAIITKRHPSVIPHTHDSNEINFSKVFDCDNTVNVGDVVYLSQTMNTYIYTNTDNREDLLSIGIVIEKPTIVTAVVQIYGDCNIVFSGLEQGKRVWVSPTGGVTTQVPINGYAHIIGMCYEDDKIFINPELIKLKRNPF